jgi:transcriptional regulatory protein RtcR
MATLAPGGRIGMPDVHDEIERLKRAWNRRPASKHASEHKRIQELLGSDRYAELDLFDQVQLAGVLDVCAKSSSLSAAGRTLFAQSLKKRASTNDADQLRKYLARFGLDWTSVRD